MPGRFVFVGERPSQRAARMMVTWEDGRLAAFTLHAALRAVGLEPAEHRYLNLWLLPELDPERDPLHEAAQVGALRGLLGLGYEVVGMGQKVCRVLEREGLAHRPMRHPATRGAGRKREVYQQHVREVLNGTAG